MRKFTKLFLTAALLIVGVGTANAGKYHASLSKDWYCATSWNSGTSTMSWTGVWAPPSGEFGSYYFINTGLPSGDITSYTKFHATLASFSDNVNHIWLRIKQGDNNYADAKLFAGENNIDLAALAAANPGVDFTKVTDITLWGAREALEEKTIDGEHPASVVIKNVYLYKPTDVVICTGFGDAVTSLDYITDGGKFIISDNGAKAIYYTGNQDYKNSAYALVPNDSYFYMKLEKIDDSGVEGDNIYRIRIQNGDGTDYPHGISGGSYVNITSWGSMFSGTSASGANKGYGVDGENWGLWYVSYDAEKGFSFQNVGREKWMKVDGTSDDQKYLKLYKSLGFTVNSELDPIDENVEITVDAETRNYQLYVPVNATANCPLVISLHGANGASTNYSPFKKGVADVEGCIVVYPQGKVTDFPIGFGGSTTGWTASGEDNFDVDFIKAVIEDVASKYEIDRKRIYCCGFSNGGMMTYALSNTCSDEIAAFASISGYPINEFHLRHTGARPVPFLHIHGKADDFVLYSKMPTIVDEMVARLGANPVPTSNTVSGKYTKNVYEAGDGSFQYVYYEVDGMGHQDYTTNTEDGNSAQTMWNFFEQYTLDSSCDETLKWAPRIEEAGFAPASHGWTVNDGTTLLQFGGAQYTVDNKNVYHSLQLDNGEYKLCFNSTGAAVSMGVQIQKLTSPNTIVLDETVNVGENAVLPFEVTDGWGEYQLSFTRPSESDAITISDVAVRDGSWTGGEETAAEKGIKTPLLLLKDGEINTADFTVTPVTPSTLTTENLYGATFTTLKGSPCNTFQYKKLDVSKYDKAVIKFGEPIADADQWAINLPDGSHPSLSKGITEYEVDLTGVDTYDDFTVFSWWSSGKSITISEVYLYTDKYVVQRQEQTVYNLGSALSLSSIVSGETLVSISSGGNIMYGTHADNQIYAKAVKDAMSAVKARGSNESTYRFRISESTDDGVTYPDGVTTLYKIRAYKGDGSVVYTGPWGGDGFVADLDWTYNVHSDGNDYACYYAITAVGGKDNTYKITSYKKDGTKVRDNIYGKSEWTFNVVSEDLDYVDVWVEIPTLSFNENGYATTSYESMTTTGGLSFNSATGVLSTDGTAGTLSLEFYEPVDLKYLKTYNVNRSGNDAIVDRVKFYDADDNLINTWNGNRLGNSGLDNNATNAFINNNPVKKLVWESDASKSTDLKLTITEITWQLKTMSCLKAGETQLNSLAYQKMNGDATSPTWNVKTSTDTYYGTGTGDAAVSYTNLSSYNELRIYRDDNTGFRAFFINAAGTNVNAINQENLASTWNAEGKYWSIDLSKVEKYGEIIALQGIKSAGWGQNNIVNNIAVYATPGANAPKYVLAGSGFQLAETEAALADATATAIDATGVTGITTNSEAGRTLLTSANPNCLFLGTTGNGGLANTQNVITSGTCANLVLTDNYPFQAPEDFTATAASYSTTINTTAQCGTLCLPFAATIPGGVTAYTLSYVSGNDAATLTPVETTIPANTPVLLNGSGAATFTGSGAVDADATNVSGALTGVFANTVVPLNSYVLQNGASGIGFYKVASDITAKPFRAYLTGEFAGSKDFLSFNFDKPTAISQVQGSGFKVQDSEIFNVAGQRLSKLQKGLNIVNGKKVMVK